MKIIPQGAVLKVTRWFGDRHYTVDPPAWAVVDEADTPDNGVFVTWLLNRPQLDPDDTTCDVVDTRDHYAVVPARRWPEEVCVAMAKRALIGDDNDQGR
jgi:hypothetical protein